VENSEAIVLHSLANSLKMPMKQRLSRPEPYLWSHFLSYGQMGICIVYTCFETPGVNST
jgi:hypothetical protein